MVKLKMLSSVHPITLFLFLSSCLSFLLSLHPLLPPSPPPLTPPTPSPRLHPYLCSIIRVPCLEKTSHCRSILAPSKEAIVPLSNRACPLGRLQWPPDAWLDQPLDRISEYLLRWIRAETEPWSTFIKVDRANGDILFAFCFSNCQSPKKGIQKFTVFLLYLHIKSFLFDMSPTSTRSFWDVCRSLLSEI